MASEAPSTTHEGSAAASLLIIAGLRASGKSTIGPLLAERLKLPFSDLDHETALTMQGAHGVKSVSELFQTAGEPAFRTAECDAFARVTNDALASSGLVLALGGGTLMQDRAQATLRQLRARTPVFVLLLDPPVAIMRARLEESAGDRPSLTGASVSDEVAAVATQRLGTYRAFADAIIHECSAPDTVAQACVDAYRRWKQA